MTAKVKEQKGGVATEREFKQGRECLRRNGLDMMRENRRQVLWDRGDKCIKVGRREATRDKPTKTKRALSGRHLLSRGAKFELGITRHAEHIETRESTLQDTRIEGQDI